MLNWLLQRPRLVGGAGAASLSLFARLNFKSQDDKVANTPSNLTTLHVAQCTAGASDLNHRSAGASMTTCIHKTPRYVPVPLHFKVPHGIFLHEATSVAVDSHDRVFVFNRGNMPMVVFDSDGNCINQW